MRKALKIFGLILLSLLLAVMLAAGILNESPRCQTFLTQKILSHLDGTVMDAHFDIGKVRIKHLNSLELTDVVWIDNNPYTADTFKRGWEPVDTIAKIRQLNASFNLKSLAGLDKPGFIHIHKVVIHGAEFNLVNEPFPWKEGVPPGNMNRIFRGEGPGSEYLPKTDLLAIDSFEMYDSRYTMRNFRKEVRPHVYGVNFDNLNLDIYAARAHDFSWKQGRASAWFDQLDFCDRNSGYSAKTSGYAATGQGVAEFRDFKINDGHSDVDIEVYSMSYDAPNAWPDFEHKVRLYVNARPSDISFYTISSFSGALPGCGLRFKTRSLEAGGPINDLAAKHFDATEVNSGIDINVSAFIKGLVDNSISMDADFEELAFTMPAIADFIECISPQTRLPLDSLAKDIPFIFRGKTSGPINKLRLDGKFFTPEGDISAGIDVLNLADLNKPLQYNGRIELKEVNVGRFIGTDVLGPATLYAISNGSMDANSVRIEVDTLSARKITALGYAYTDIIGNGVYDGRSFDGKVSVSDPNLSMLFQGFCGFSEESGNAIYKFVAGLSYADLHAIGLDKNREISRLSGTANVNLRAIDGDKILGSLYAKNFRYIDADGSHPIGNITMTSQTVGDLHRLVMNSSFADLSYEGDCFVFDAVDPLKSAVIASAAPSLLDGTKPYNGNSFKVKFLSHDTENVFRLLCPGLELAQDSRAEMKLDSDGLFEMAVEVPSFATGANIFRDIKINAKSTLESGLALNGGVDLIDIGDLDIDSTTVAVSMLADNFDLSVDCPDAFAGDADAHLVIDGRLFRDSKNKLAVEGRPRDSRFRLTSQLWTITADKLALSEGGFDAENFLLESRDGVITIDGGYSNTIDRDLSAHLGNFNLSSINYFIADDMAVEGEIDGDVHISSPARTNAGLNAAIAMNGIRLGGREAGDISIDGHLLENSRQISFNIENTLKEARPIKVEGLYDLDSKSLDAGATLTAFNPGVIQPLIEDVFSELDGSVSGGLTAKGPLDNLTFGCEGLSITDTRARVAFTNVLYNIFGTIRYDDNGIFVDNLTVSDEDSGHTLVNGRPDNLSIAIRNFKALDKKSDGVSPVSGRANINGDIVVRTPDLKNFNIEADMSTSGPGKVNISLDGGASADASILTFKELDSRTGKISGAMKKPGTSNGSVKLKGTVRTTPEFEAVVEIDKTSGNALNAYGEGLVSIEADSETGKFTLGGDYNLQGGRFHFATLGELISKDFDIQDGSSIKFGGDVMDTQFDVKATHTIKTSIGPLISDTTSVSTSRSVICGINITDKLSSPEIKFSIDIPDLDPTTKSLVESELNTEDKVQRQFIGLLVTSTFIPSERGGITNNTGQNILYKNVAAMMAGQLNNILQKFDIPLDFGLSYQKNEVGSDIFDVAVSTQLFNNKVVVNGSLGNRRFNVNSKEEVVGDVDIEVKLDREGKLRLKLFSHSADDYTNYLDNTQRNGIGVSFQQEYNNFFEYLGNIFNKKKTSRDTKSKGMQTMKITANNG